MTDPGPMMLRGMLWGASILSLAALAACQPGLDQAPDAGAQLVAYAIAHGMAESYIDSAAADPAVVLQLQRLDVRALTAIAGDGDGDGAARAVAALTKLAARQSEGEP